MQKELWPIVNKGTSLIPCSKLNKI